MTKGTTATTMPIRHDAQVTQSRTRMKPLPFPLLSCGHRVVASNQPHYCRYVGASVEDARSRPNAGTHTERDYAHDDEPLFIDVHRVCETWFRQTILALSSAIEAIGDAHRNSLMLVARMMCRAAQCLDQSADAMSVLFTMQPQDFAAFRQLLMPASGAESIRWRIIELRSGIRPETPYVTYRNVEYTYREYLERIGEGPGEPRTQLWTEELERIAIQPDLTTEVRRAAAKTEHALLDISSLAGSWNELVCALVTYARALDRVRRVHRELTQFQIGKDQGSIQREDGNHDSIAPAVALLGQIRDRHRLFPELWNPVDLQ